MSAYPSDIRAKANDVFSSLSSTRDEIEQYVFLGDLDAICGAILDERNRCYRVAMARINMYGEANAISDGAALSIAHGIITGEIPE